MSGERQFKATPRRRQEARKKGQILKSQELTSGIIFLGMFLLLKFWLPIAVLELGRFSKTVFQQPQADLTDAAVRLIINQAVVVGAKVVAPLAAGGVVFAILANFLQIGSLFSVSPLAPDFQRINPVAGFQRLFSVRSLVELLKSLLKLAILGYLVYQAFMSGVAPRLGEIQASPLATGIRILGEALVGLTWKVALFFIVLGIGDYLYQWWEYERSLKMSHQELKEEMKSTEGDPLLKGEIKRKQKAMAMRRMMQEVPRADVVITNPTHFAVAIRYDSESMDAPQVVAKGQDEVALRIKEAAREHEVPLVENPPLARTLFRSVEIGQPVPHELYKGVAEVLAFVYRLNRRRIS